MFKNLTLARVKGLTSAGDLGVAARDARFMPCGPTQQASVGFVPPREANGAWCESIAGHWIVAVKIQTKTVPPSEIDKWVDAAAGKVEHETGRKPGKKQRRELKEQALLELLPKAFPKDKVVLVWIDSVMGLVALGTASAATADAVWTLLAQVTGASFATVQTVVAPAAWLKDMLLEGTRGPFDIGREVEMYAPDTGAKVRFSDHDLANSSVRNHIQNGKRVSRLALEWTNGTVADFVLDDSLVLRKVDVTVPPAGEPAVDAFDADVTIHCGTLRLVLADLITALCGEVRHD